MTKDLNKAIMKRSKLRNTFLKEKVILLEKLTLHNGIFVSTFSEKLKETILQI